MLQKTGFRQKAALLVCLCFLAVTVLSVSYQVVESDHVCTGHHCPICANMHDAQKVLHQLGQSLFGLTVFAAVMAATLLCLIFPGSLNDYRDTLVSQKIRMNN